MQLNIYYKLYDIISYNNSNFKLTSRLFQVAEIISSFNTFINEIDYVWQSGDEKMESSGKNVRENGMEKIGSDHASKMKLVNGHTTKSNYLRDTKR